MIVGATSVAPQGFTLSGILNAGISWATMALMPTARGFLAAATVNGKIYAIGGMTELSGYGGSPLSTVEIYDPATDSWSTGTPMPKARGYLAAAVVNGKIYVIGGTNGSTDPGGFGGLLAEPTVQVFDPAGNNGAGSWTTAASMPTARYALGAAVVNGKIYTIGGRYNIFYSASTCNNCFNSTTAAAVEIYDPATDTWSTGASMPTAREYLATTAVNGRVYAMGGQTPGVGQYDVLNTLEVYNPTTDAWSTRAGMPSARYDLSAANVNGIIYAIGGTALSSGTYPVVQATVDLYDTARDTWTTAASLLNERTGLAASDANGFIYAIGGYNHDSQYISHYVVGFVQKSPPPLLYTFIKN